MRVVFTDIDGVLNHPAAFERGESLDPVCVTELESLAAMAAAYVVISSSWRKWYSVSELAAMLATRGLSRYRVIDVTGDRSMTGIGVADPSTRFRGAEIADWLAERPVERYVILDDDPDMLAHQWPCFVQTDPFVGLTRADALIARRVLIAYAKPPLGPPGCLK